MADLRVSHARSAEHSSPSLSHSYVIMGYSSRCLSGSPVSAGREMFSDRYDLLIQYIVDLYSSESTMVSTSVR